MPDEHKPMLQVWVRHRTVLPRLQQSLLLRVLVLVELLEMATVELLQAPRHLKTVKTIHPLVSLSCAQCGSILRLHRTHQSPGKLISLGTFVTNLVLRKFSVMTMTTLTEVFPCFFPSCKANARVKPAKTGQSVGLWVRLLVWAT